MCNLYSNLTTHEAMLRLFDVHPADNLLPADWRPVPSIFPKHQAAVVHIGEGGRRRLAEMQWGFLLPQVSRRTGEPILPKAVTNARDDRIRNSRFWSDSLRKRRCLVPATAYCEFSGRSPTRHHWYGVSPDGKRPEPFGFAGIWTRFEGVVRNERKAFFTFAIATTSPNALAAQVHNRMPVILGPERHEQWLTGSVDAAVELLQPAPDAVMVKLEHADRPASAT